MEKLSSCIAVIVLEDCWTRDTTFKIPPLKIGIQDLLASAIFLKKITGKLLWDWILIVWDNASMSHKILVETLDRTMRYLHNSPMDGSKRDESWCSQQHWNSFLNLQLLIKLGAAPIILQRKINIQENYGTELDYK